MTGSLDTSTQPTTMQVASATQTNLRYESDKKVVSSETKVSNSKDIFFPQEMATYQCEGVKFFGKQLCFRTTNEDALFYSITLTKEDGRGIAIDSNFIKDMKKFLSENEIPIRGWG